jgi:uncharacterized protein YkwD
MVRICFSIVNVDCMARTFPAAMLSMLVLVAPVAVSNGWSKASAQSLPTPQLASAGEASDASDEASFVARINDARREAGLNPLATNDALVRAARDWAAKMRDVSAAANTDQCLISHNPNLRTVVDAAWLVLGENVGCGGSSVETLHQAFLNSPKHRENILNIGFDSVGIGIVRAGNTMFVTEQFMKTDKSPTAAGTPMPEALALKSVQPMEPRFIGPIVTQSAMIALTRHVKVKVAWQGQKTKKRKSTKRKTPRSHTVARLPPEPVPKRSALIPPLEKMTPLAFSRAS